MTKQEALKKLWQLDHCWVTDKMAKEIAEPFGVKPGSYKSYDTRSQFKSLTLHGINPLTKEPYKEGDYAYGIDASSLACDICLQLKIEYDSYFGRGSQLAECCKRIRDYLAKSEKATS
jgi:hypothetical protein